MKSDIAVSWSKLKAKGLSLYYSDRNDNYYVFSVTELWVYDCVLPKGSSDAIDFENNYKGSAESLD